MNAATKTKTETLEPSALWLALTAIPRPTMEIPIPRLNDKGEPAASVLMWPLKQEELMASNAEADRFAKKLMKDPQKKDEANLGYHHNFTNEVAIQVLFRACRDPQDVNRPAFPTPDKVRAEFTTDEIGVLFNNYCTVQSEVGPIIAHMSDEEYEAMVLRLVEGGTAFPFDSLSWEEQRALVRFMASRLVSCWTAMFSAGLPPSVSALVSERLEPSAEDSPAADPEVIVEE